MIFLKLIFKSGGNTVLERLLPNEEVDGSLPCGDMYMFTRKPFTNGEKNLYSK